MGKGNVSTKVLASFILLTSILVIPCHSAGIAGPRAGTCYVDEDATEVRVGNDLVELSFRKDTKGGLDRVLDKTSGIDLRPDKEVPPVLYAIFYDPGTGTDAALQWDATSVTYDHSVSSTGCELFINSTGIKGHVLDTSVHIRLEEGASLFKMRMDIECGSDFVIKYAFFPLVWGMGAIGPEQDDDHIFYPTGDGIVLRDPLRDIESLYLSDMYPAGVSMQFMCHYDPDEAGLYLATQDTEGYPKKLNMVSLDWDSQRRLSSYFQLFPPEYPGNGLNMTYDALLGTFHGDWYNAADIYSEWAMTTPFVSGGKVGIDKDTPEWWMNTSVLGVANRDREIVHNTLPSIVNMTGEMSDLTGLNTTALIFAWEKEGGWVGPNFFPPAEGEDEFISAMEDLEEGGDRGFVYMSGTVWRITRDDIGYSNWTYFNSTGRPWAATKEDQSVLMDENYASIGWQCARMCPFTDFWHDLVVDNFLELIKLGVDVVQIDEFPIGTMYPCYNTSHGHPAGYSVEMSIALRSILEDCRSQGRDRNPDLVMSCEEPCELYLPYLDTYVSRDNAEEYMLYPWMKQAYVDRVQFVPAFGYVYHEYITAFGEPLYLGKSYPEQLNFQIKRGLARSMVQGEIVSGGGAAQSDIWHGLLELYDRTAKASATYANDYMVRGRMLRPPTIDVPLEQVQWYFGYIGMFGNPFNESAVVNGAFRSPSGDIGHVLANWIDAPVEFDLDLDRFDLGPGNVSVIMTVNGDMEVIAGSLQMPYALHLDLGPNDVVLVELTRAPDITVDSGGPGTVLTNDTIVLDVTFGNGGSVPTGPFKASVFLDGGSVGAVDVPTIAPGSTHAIEVHIDTTGMIGVHTIAIESDPDGLVRELDEDNNRATIGIEVIDRPRSSLDVRVLDNVTSGPIEGCKVVLTPLGGEPTSVQTDLTGHASFLSIVAGSYGLTVNCSGFSDDMTALSLPEGIELNVTVRLEPLPVLYVLRGIITDNSTSEALEGVELDLTPLGSGSGARTVLSDALGGFSFAGIPEGDYLLNASLDGYSSRTVGLSVPVGSLTITMDPIPPAIATGSLRGTVYGRSGAPVRGAKISLHPSGPNTTTGVDGSYVCDGLIAGTYAMNVTADGFIPYERQVEIVAGLVLQKNVTLDPVPPVPIGWISGHVRDVAGSAVPGARVNGEDNVTLAISDGDGLYMIGDLAPGTYSFTVWASGYYPKEMTGIVIDGDNVTVDVTLVPIPEEGDDGSDKGDANMVICVLVIVAILAIVAGAALFLMRRKPDPERWQEE